MRKKNVKLWNHLTQNLDDFEILAGWFESSRYDDGTPIGGIAAVQNYGAHITQNITDKQRAFFKHLKIFIKKTTTQLNIVIPPRPFMDNAKKRIQGEEGKKIVLQEMLRVFEAKQTIEQAAQRLGIWAQGVIQDEIRKITSPSLSPLTIQERANKYISKSKNTSDKPLNSTGLMFETVQYRAGRKGSVNKE